MSCTSWTPPDRPQITSGKFAANAAWLVLACIAFNLTRAAAAIGGGPLTKATTGTVRIMTCRECLI